MALPALSPSAVRKLVTRMDHGEKFVMQCIGVKQLAAQGNNPVPERFRLALSDGELWTSVMLATQLNHLVKDHLIENGSVIRLQDNLAQDMPNRRYPVLVVLKLDVLGKDGQRGSPTNVDTIDIGAPLNSGSEAAQGSGAGPQGGSGPNQNGGMGPGSNAYGPPGQGTYGGAGRGYSGGAQQNGQYGAQQGGQPGYSAPGAGPAGGAGYGSNAGSAYGQPAGGPSYGNAPGSAPGGGYGGSGYGGAGTGRGGYGGGMGNGPGGGYGGGQGRGAYGGSGPGGTYGQPAPMYRAAGGGPTARNEAPARIMPISGLNAYQNRWTIKARVTQKSDLRRWTNARGEGKFFTCDLLDAQGGEIRCIAFNDQADKFDSVIQMGAVLMISKASLKPKRGNYNQTRHDFEIHLENASQVEPCPEEAEEIPQIQYHFKKLEELETTPANNIVDVIGIVEHVEAWTTITRKDGTETQKRSVTIKDKTNRSIEVSFWGRFAQDPGNDLEQKVMQQEMHPVLTIKGARVGDFNGKSLSTVSSSIVATDPDIPECLELQQWYGAGGAQVKAASLSDSRMSGGRQDRRCTLQHIKDEQLGQGAPAYIQVSAWVTFIRNEAAKMYYPACTLSFNGRTCNKKLSDQGGQWWCERCNQPSQPEFRYILSLAVKDHTTEQWLTAFQESGQDIMGLSADDLRNLENSESDFSLAVQAATFKQLLFKLKIAEENYNDENRIKMSVVRVEPLDFVKEGRVMLDWIHKLQAGEQIMQPSASTPAASSYTTPGLKPGGGFGSGTAGYGRAGQAYGASAGYGGAGMNNSISHQPYGSNNGYAGGNGGYTGGYGGGGFGPGGF